MAVKGPNHQMRTRIRGLTVLFALIGFGLVGVRLLYMQVFNHDFYVQQATALQTRDTFITPNRGKIDPRGERRRPHAERAAAVRERAAQARDGGQRGHQHRGHGPAVRKVAGAGHGGAQGRGGVFGCDGSVRHGAIVTVHRAGNALEWRPCRRTS